MHRRGDVLVDETLTLTLILTLTLTLTRCTAAETYWLTYTALPSGAAKKMESPSLAKDSESVPG